MGRSPRGPVPGWRAWEPWCWGNLFSTPFALISGPYDLDKRAFVFIVHAKVIGNGDIEGVDMDVFLAEDRLKLADHIVRRLFIAGIAGNTRRNARQVFDGLRHTGGLDRATVFLVDFGQVRLGLRPE